MGEQAMVDTGIEVDCPKHGPKQKTVWIDPRHYTLCCKKCYTEALKRTPMRTRPPADDAK